MRVVAIPRWREGIVADAHWQMIQSVAYFAIAFVLLYVALHGPEESRLIRLWAFGLTVAWGLFYAVAAWSSFTDILPSMFARLAYFSRFIHFFQWGLFALLTYDAYKVITYERIREEVEVGFQDGG